MLAVFPDVATPRTVDAGDVKYSLSPSRTKAGPAEGEGGCCGWRGLVVVCWSAGLLLRRGPRPAPRPASLALSAGAPATQNRANSNSASNPNPAQVDEVTHLDRIDVAPPRICAQNQKPLCWCFWARAGTQGHGPGRTTREPAKHCWVQ